MRCMVKQVCDSNKVRRNKEGVPIEADVTAHLAHPNLVRTIDTASAYREPLHKLNWEVTQDAAAAPESPAKTPVASPGEEEQPVEETWLLLEYCDQGSFIVRSLPMLSFLLLLCECKRNPSSVSGSNVACSGQ